MILSLHIVNLREGPAETFHPFRLPFECDLAPFETQRDGTRWRIAGRETVVWRFIDFAVVCLLQLMPGATRHSADVR